MKEKLKVEKKKKLLQGQVKKNNVIMWTGQVKGSAFSFSLFPTILYQLFGENFVAVLGTWLLSFLYFLLFLAKKFSVSVPS